MAGKENNFSPPLVSSVTLGKSFNLFGLRWLLYKKRLIICKLAEVIYLMVLITKKAKHFSLQPEFPCTEQTSERELFPRATAECRTNPRP